jgi:hypothetical protein
MIQIYKSFSIPPAAGKGRRRTPMPMDRPADGSQKSLSRKRRIVLDKIKDALF